MTATIAISSPSVTNPEINEPPLPSNIAASLIARRRAGA